jgi:hypothetical protein
MSAAELLGSNIERGFSKIVEQSVYRLDTGWTTEGSEFESR